MTVTHEQANCLNGQRCPVCESGVVLAWGGVGGYYVGCAENDFLDDEDPRQCAFEDVWGGTAEAAIANFIAAAKTNPPSLPASTAQGEKP